MTGDEQVQRGFTLVEVLIAVVLPVVPLGQGIESLRALAVVSLDDPRFDHLVEGLVFNPLPGDVPHADLALARGRQHAEQDVRLELFRELVARALHVLRERVLPTLDRSRNLVDVGSARPAE